MNSNITHAASSEQPSATDLGQLFDLANQLRESAESGTEHVLSPQMCALLFRAMTTNPAGDGAGTSASMIDDSDRERLLYAARVLRWAADTVRDNSLYTESVMAFGAIKRVLDIKDEECEALGLTSARMTEQTGEDGRVVGDPTVRAEFEAFAHDKDLDLTRAVWPEDEEGYQHGSTQIAWCAYKHAKPNAPLARAIAATDLENRNRVASALGMPANGLRDGKPVSFAWSYLIGCISDMVKYGEVDSERIDWIESVLTEHGGAVWFCPSGPDLRYVQVRKTGDCHNGPTVEGLRRAIDAARREKATASPPQRS